MTLNSRKLRRSHLQDTGLDNGWLLVEVDLATSAASRLERLDNLPGIVIVQLLAGWADGLIELSEDDVLAIEPAGDNGGNEELGAVAAAPKR
jgi:hypothetical protein